MSRLSSWKKFGIPFPNNPLLKLLLIISSFVFAIAFIPVIGSFCLLLLPMILFFNGTVNDKTVTTAAFLIPLSLLFILSTLFHLNLPTIVIFSMGMTGLLLVRIAAHSDSIEKIIIYPALFIIAMVCFYFIYGGIALSVNPWQLVEKYITAIVQENVKLYSQLPLKSEDINFIKDNEINIIDGFIQIFPAMVIISSTLIIWANFLLGKQMIGKAGIIWPKFTGLARWKSPDFMIWIFIISGGLFFVPYKNINIVGLNIFLVTCLIYLLQGLAIVSFLFQSRKAPLFLRYLFYFFVAVQQLLMIPIIAIGLFDIWIDFRKYFQKDQTTT